MGKKNRVTAAAAVLVTAVFCALGGCAGPSTRILPGGRAEVKEPQVILPDEVVLEEANPFYLQEALEVIAGSPRGGGQKEEEQTVAYISRMLTDYGYQVTLQKFQVREPSGETVLRTNVAAVRPGPSPEADMVLVGCCHGTAAGSPGAVHSASGVVAMLETARLLSMLPTDTELRFVSFSDGSGADPAVHRYLSGLSEEERQRVVGVVQLGALGYGPSMVLRTDDGKATLLGDLMRETADALFRETWTYRRQEPGIPSLFVRQGIPAVEAGQPWEAYEAGSPYDRTGLVDIDQVARVVNTLSRVLADMMGSETPSLVAKSRFYNNLHAGEYVQKEEPSICFGESHAQTDIRLSMTGTPASENTDSQGSTIRSYQYRMKWFNVDQVILTSYYYTDDRLEEIALDSDGAGIGLEEMKERISQIYGVPWATSAGPNGVEYHWEDPVFRLHFTLTPSSGGYETHVREYDAPRRELFTGQFVKPGDGQVQPEADREPVEEQETGVLLVPAGEAAGGAASAAEAEGVERILDMVEGLYPEELAGYLKAVHIYTDGVGAGGNYVEPAADPEEEDSVGFGLWIDWNDVLYPDGTFRDRTGFVRQMLNLQGEILRQAEEGYRTEFAAIFPQENRAEESGLSVQPGVAPGELAVTLPDFGESYQWFVLVRLGQEEQDPFSQQIRFFYGREPLVQGREKIRDYLMKQE